MAILDLIFYRHEVIGRFIMPVKICSCPKRDKDREEADARSKKDNNQSSGQKRKNAPQVEQNKEDPKKVKVEDNVPHQVI